MSFLTTKLANIIQLKTATNGLNRSTVVPMLGTLQAKNYAARKGTRERKKKAKVKVEVQKVGFIPHNLRNRERMLAARASKKFDDSWKRDPIDDVYAMKYYKWIVYPFADAVQAHRETHHPEMYNKPEAELRVTVELNTQGEKKTRFVDNFTRIVSIPHTFDHGEERSVIAFVKNEEGQRDAINAGAQLVGGADLIKQIQNGLVSLTDFQHIVAHPDILAELVVLRGVMKKRFPAPKPGTLNVDMGQMVKKFLKGIKYQVIKDEYEKDYGQIDVIIGTLNMNEKHLEENFEALLRDIDEQRPKREGSFITRCLLWSPPSREKFKVDHNVYINEKSPVEQDNDLEPERVAL